jgi:nucleotide-binding universal stress UspA family protein
VVDGAVARSPAKGAEVFSRIVIGTDGSESANAALDMAIELAREHGATLHIVNAFKPPSSAAHVAVAGAAVSGDFAQAAMVSGEASEQLLERAASRADGLNVEVHSVNNSAPEAVLAVADAVNADLIVVGNKGMQRKVFGSVPNSIAHKAPCNLLIAKTT